MSWLWRCSRRLAQKNLEKRGVSTLFASSHQAILAHVDLEVRVVTDGLRPLGAHSRAKYGPYTT